MTKNDGEKSASASEWMPASEALQLLKNHFGGPVATKVMLADLLRDGYLSCRAGKVWESSEPSITLAWKNRTDADFETDTNVSPHTWQSSRFWADDIDQWRWPKNRFVITKSKRPADRTIIEGVTLKTQEVHGLLAGLNMGPEKSKGGRPKKAEEWLQFWFAVIRLAQDNRLNAGEFRSQEALRAELIDRMPAGNLSDDSIKVPVRRIWSEFSLPTDE